jgi:hypothetical protein
MSQTYVDGFLVDWDASFFNQKPVSATSPKRGITGLLVPKKTPAKKAGNFGGGVSSNARAIRSKLGGIYRKTPEVMVKISGGGKGRKQVGNHLDYISRNGVLEIEDQNGEVITGRDDLLALKDEWEHGGFPISEQSDAKDAFNIVLSMPAGTNELAVKRAARDFAAAEFADHQYVMVLHTYSTDPDKNPSKNPHVHLCVKARSLDGVRLNPRKNDLQRWREDFAKELRNHGVEANATKREYRNLRSRSSDQTKFLSVEKQLEKEGKTPSVKAYKPVTEDRKQKAKSTEEIVVSRYRNLAEVLARSNDPVDRELLKAVNQQFQFNKKGDRANTVVRSEDRKQ